MIRGFNLWGNRIVEGVLPEPRAGWNAELAEVAKQYKVRNYERNENGFLMRKAGAPENMLLAMPEQLRNEFGQFLKGLFKTYIEDGLGGDTSTMEEPLFATSCAHTENCEPSFPHQDHGAQLVIAYFADAYLEEEKHPSAGNFVALDPRFPSAYHMGGALQESHMFMHRPQVGSFVIYAPETIHMHAPTFSQNSRRCVIDTFINFRKLGRLPRTAGAIPL